MSVFQITVNDNVAVALKGLNIDDVVEIDGQSLLIKDEIPLLIRWPSSS